MRAACMACASQDTHLGLKLVRAYISLKEGPLALSLGNQAHSQEKLRVLPNALLSHRMTSFSSKSSLRRRVSKTGGQKAPQILQTRQKSGC